MPQPSIIVKNVSAKWQGNTVLNDVSFTLLAGEHLLVTGASGSGKTMLAQAIAGKLFHNGSVDFFADGAGSKPSIVFVQQHYHFRNLSNVQSFYYQQRFNSFDGDDAQTVLQELSNVVNI
jgi:molybdate transport system ATP-binding protein